MAHQPSVWQSRGSISQSSRKPAAKSQCLQSNHPPTSYLTTSLPSPIQPGRTRLPPWSTAYPTQLHMLHVGFPHPPVALGSLNLPTSLDSCGPLLISSLRAQVAPRTVLNPVAPHSLLMLRSYQTRLPVLLQQHLAAQVNQHISMSAATQMEFLLTEFHNNSGKPPPQSSNNATNTH